MFNYQGMNNIGKELDKIRIKLGISQHKLSSDTGIPIATLQRLLWGRTATWENVVIVADTMNLEITLKEKTK